MCNYLIREGFQKILQALKFENYFKLVIFNSGKLEILHRMLRLYPLGIKA